MTRIYLGNLPQDITEASLRDLLAQEGRTVTLVNIKRNGTTKKSRGFAFADMGSQEEAEAAIRALQGAQLEGRTIKANFARELPAQKAPDLASSPGRFNLGSKRRR